MIETKKKLDLIKKAIIASCKEYLDFDITKDEFLLWLSQFHCPTYSTVTNWDQCLESFPDPSPNCIKPTTGLKLRFLLKLYTSKHRYIISIIECFDTDAKGIGILSVHVNLDQIEYNLIKTIEMTYKNSIDNSLRPKQTLFVEPFTKETLYDSLNHAGFSILGNELLANIPKPNQPTIKHIMPLPVHFPDTDEII